MLAVCPAHIVFELVYRDLMSEGAAKIQNVGKVADGEKRPLRSALGHPQAREPVVEAVDQTGAERRRVGGNYPAAVVQQRRSGRFTREIGLDEVSLEPAEYTADVEGVAPVLGNVVIHSRCIHVIEGGLRRVENKPCKRQAPIQPLYRIVTYRQLRHILKHRGVNPQSGGINRTELSW